MGETMTSRERWLAAVRGQPVDRLPFWPKIDGAYAGHQAEPYRQMDNPALHHWIGSDRHVGGPAGVRVVRSRTRVEHREQDGWRHTEYRTPAGVLTATHRFDPGSASWHPVEFPVKKVSDLEAMALAFADQRLELDPEELERAHALVAEIGEQGVTATNIGVSPLMDWLQHLAGIEQGHLLLSDHPAEVEALFAVMHQALCRRAEIIADRAPYPLVYSTENTSTTLISPALFRRYCHRHLADYGRIVTAAGKHHILHMCGHLKALLPDIAALPAAGIEAFTTPPVGNTTLGDGRAACPRQCLIGGTNASLWLQEAPAIIAELERDLGALPHRRGLVVTSAGVMPPAARPETIRQVAEWVKGYPV